MRIFWWQGGVHIHPETDEESDALLVITKSLESAQFNDGIPSSPTGTIQTDDDQSVI